MMDKLRPKVSEPERARNEGEKLIQEKIKKGYIEIK